MDMLATAIFDSTVYRMKTIQKHKQISILVRKNQEESVFLEQLCSATRLGGEYFVRSIDSAYTIDNPGSKPNDCGNVKRGEGMELWSSRRFCVSCSLRFIG